MGSMKYLETYNESIRDKMTAKDLSNNQQLVYDAAMDLESIDIPVNGITSKNASYGFSIYHYDKKMGIYYTDQEEAKKIFKKRKLKEKIFGWHMYVINADAGTRTGFSSKLIVPKEDTWNSMFLEIINIYYKNPDQKREDAIKSIIQLEDKIENKKELIETLDKVIEIKNKIK